MPTAVSVEEIEAQLAARRALLGTQATPEPVRAADAGGAGLGCAEAAQAPR